MICGVTWGKMINILIFKILMANFTRIIYQKNDDYMTPAYAWEDIQEYIPKHKVIWDPFFGDGQSGKTLTRLGFNTIHENIDFFQYNLGDVIVTNPPFSQIPQIISRLKELEKPFIMIMPSSKINTQYFRKLFSEDKNPIQIIIPKKRINFYKFQQPFATSNCAFDCFYYCWKIGLERDITWLI